MDEVEIIHEISDRHADHLIYDGAYRLTPLLGSYGGLGESLGALFEDWRQRIYRFENDLGASVVFYHPVQRPRMTWDLVVARFTGGDPFDFRYAAEVRSDLRWREVQRLLDDIKTKRP